MSDNHQNDRLDDIDDIVSQTSPHNQSDVQMVNIHSTLFENNVDKSDIDKKRGYNPEEELQRTIVNTVLKMIEQQAAQGFELGFLKGTTNTSLGTKISSGADLVYKIGKMCLDNDSEVNYEDFQRAVLQGMAKDTKSDTNSNTVSIDAKPAGENHRKKSTEDLYTKSIQTVFPYGELDKDKYQQLTEKGKDFHDGQGRIVLHNLGQGGM